MSILSSLFTRQASILKAIRRIKKIDNEEKASGTNSEKFLLVASAENAPNSYDNKAKNAFKLLVAAAVFPGRPGTIAR